MAGKSPKILGQAGLEFLVKSQKSPKSNAVSFPKNIPKIGALPAEGLFPENTKKTTGKTWFLAKSVVLVQHPSAALGGLPQKFGAFLGPKGLGALEYDGTSYNACNSASLQENYERVIELGQEMRLGRITGPNSKLPAGDRDHGDLFVTV